MTIFPKKFEKGCYQNYLGFFPNTYDTLSSLPLLLPNSGIVILMHLICESTPDSITYQPSLQRVQLIFLLSLRKLKLGLSYVFICVSHGERVNVNITLPMKKYIEYMSLQHAKNYVINAGEVFFPNKLQLLGSLIDISSTTHPKTVLSYPSPKSALPQIRKW